MLEEVSEWCKRHKDIVRELQELEIEAELEDDEFDEDYLKKKVGDKYKNLPLNENRLPLQ